MHHRADSKADESVSQGADGLMEEVRNTANVLTLLWGEKRKKIDLRVAASDTVRNMHVKQIKASKLKEGIRGWGEVTGEPWGAGAGELTGLRISLEARTPGPGEEGGGSHRVRPLGTAALGSASTGDGRLGLLEGGFRVLCLGGSWGSRGERQGGTLGLCSLPSLTCTCSRPGQALLSLWGSLS